MEHQIVLQLFRHRKRNIAGCMVTDGVALSNGLVAVSGALACMYQGFADVNSGTGTVVAGLASVMIGEFLLKSNRIGLLTFRVILGSILYRALMFAGRQWGYVIHLTANDLSYNFV